MLPVLKCPDMVLNLIKYIAFGLCILYALDQNKKLNYYLQRCTMIGFSMVFVEYVIKSVCRDVKENFTTGPGQIGEEEEDMEEIIENEMPTSSTTGPEIKSNEDEELNKLVDESIKDMQLENEIMEEDDMMEEKMVEEKQKIEYGYSFVHPDAMKLPEVRIPRCIQDNPCNVCPVMMGGTADLMQVKPRKKPIAGC
jgi:hypothetical protein